MRFFRQSFLGKLSAVTLVAGVATVSLSPQAMAQELIRVVDTQGHQIGVLIRAPAAQPVNVVPMQSLFENMDRMMAQQMAMMQKAEQRMIEVAQHTPAIAAPAAGMMGGSSYQSITSVSWSGNGAACSKTVTMSQNGQAAPVVHVSDTGSQAGCMQGSAAPDVRGSAPTVSRFLHHSDLVPAVDTGSAEDETKKTSSHM
ncbi:hypothetical protein EDC15_101172 [Acetobacter aceti NBRC 14818]|uniref:Uncharacterized protein n=1 Tax=Acetobacter aceti NBRC 14818 TaxID=887700 RepID=A0AB33IGY6_ACEAC|nr:hypothetical protein [Acetobacter aceti]TCS35375.1 hypothetical protein EDC15_101172 [Acetobacter aceti NBRC 14818]BCK75237.1 hypothetical protein EMQ_0843 [Acetobacter aceti NBRC 14818]GAN57473.1 hypothetical protein Abac_017_174 [Acetobacter aceti NBRC 14818]